MLYFSFDVEYTLTVRSKIRGGVGKSVITSAIVRSQEIRKRFIDGIACALWFMRLVLSEINDFFLVCL